MAYRRLAAVALIFVTSAAWTLLAAALVARSQVTPEGRAAVPGSGASKEMTASVNAAPGAVITLNIHYRSAHGQTGPINMVRYKYI